MFNSTALILRSAQGGLTLAYFAKDKAVPYIEADRATSRFG
ncbi:hypothetical protein [Methylobacterium pseudosasicola]|nr:hypothetical protein [Methylobacterium pseudosasicola]